jgi:hypothetical protein
MCTVVNKYAEPYDVYIGRGSIWGNPFKIGGLDSRVDVVAKHKVYLWKQIKAGTITKDILLSLDGKRLGCYCAPKACHGDNLVLAVRWAKERNGD